MTEYQQLDISNYQGNNLGTYWYLKDSSYSKGSKPQLKGPSGTKIVRNKEI